MHNKKGDYHENFKERELTIQKKCLYLPCKILFFHVVKGKVAAQARERPLSFLIRFNAYYKLPHRSLMNTKKEGLYISPKFF